MLVGALGGHCEQRANAMGAVNGNDARGWQWLTAESLLKTAEASSSGALPKSACDSTAARRRLWRVSALEVGQRLD